MLWKLPRHTLDLQEQACVMGILNVTPDSFSDGGQFLSTEAAVERALKMLADGAEIIDIGGESSRPGAKPVGEEEEMRRVLPVIEGLLTRAPEAIVSLDTTKASVAREGIKRGASVINDVTALLGDRAMAGVAAETGAGVVLMHMQGTPRTMQLAPRYDDPVAEVRDWLGGRLQAALHAGIELGSIALDVGIGFGKTSAHNLALLRSHHLFEIENRPMVVGISRKSFLGKMSDDPAMEARLWPALALSAMLRQKGARIFRTHDVAPTLAALRAAETLL